MAKINQINQVLQEYFKVKKSVSMSPAKDLMPYFTLAGIFEKNHKNGLPIRAIYKTIR